MMGGKKLRGNRVWTANKEGLVGREYKFSKKYLNISAFSVQNVDCFGIKI